MDDWMDLANCKGMDPDLFFPERGESHAEANAVCAPCVVRVECLTYALRCHIHEGIWGGRSERSRRRNPRVA